MMSEAGEENGEFELVDKNTNGHTEHPQGTPSTSPPTRDLPPPSALPPGLVNFGTPSPHTAPPPHPTPRPPSLSSLPPPSSFPSPPLPPTAAVPPLQNPYSIRSSSGPTVAPTGPYPPFNIPQMSSPPAPPPPPTQMMTPGPPVPPSAVVPPISSQTPVTAEPGLSAEVGLDMGVAAGSSSDVFTLQDMAAEGSGNSGLMGWIRSSVSQSELLSKIAEKAKTGVDSMITTLDPQMKEYMLASGTVEVAIASDKEVKIGGVKDGFLRVFNNVIGRGLGSPGSTSLAAQPVGFEHGIRGAEERITNLRQSGLVPKDIPIVAVEGLIFEPASGIYFDADCILLDDPSTGYHEYFFSQTTLIPPQAVQLLKKHTPSDYPYRASGFAVTTGQAMAEAVGVAPGEWKEWVGGERRRHLIRATAATLAFHYKRHLSLSSTVVALQ